MINLINLTKDDLRELFDGFNTEFLQQPLRKPTKSLSRYIPNGFRPDKMPRNLLIKMYCDAIIGHEPSITTYVVNEVERNFDSMGVEQIITSINQADNSSIIKAIAQLSATTWDGGIVIPAHLIIKMYGVECETEMVALSKSLFKAHFSAVENAERNGRNEGVVSAATDIQAEIKKQGKLQKRIDALEEQIKSSEQQLSTAISFQNDLEEKLSESANLNTRLQQVIEALNKQITILKNEIVEHISVVAKQENKLLEFENRERQLADLEVTVSALRHELEEANALAFSDDVIRRLSADVIDELKASSLGAKEILALAKKRFSESTTVEEAWINISSYSDNGIKPLIDSFSEGYYSNEMLDILEEIEDGILIKYAVIKALKGVLYHGLEEQTGKKTIADEFASSEEADL